MRETSVQRTQERELGKLVSRLVATATNRSELQWGPYLIEHLAQDQVLFKVFRGDECNTYKALRIHSKDVQSDIMFGSQSEALSVMKLCALLHDVGLSETRAWNVDDVVIEVEDSPHAGVVSGGSESDDAFDLAEESSEVGFPDRLADELLRLDVEKDRPRLGEVILTAEDFDFTPDESALLAPRLLDLATQFRDSNDSQDALVVWSAIRTGASMLRPNEARRLLALLEPGHRIETSLVALKMLGRIFEAQPPERLDQYPDIAGEVRGIAESLLNRYAIASSQSAAMAQLAVCTLAAMASSETLPIVGAVRRISVSWFSQQTARELRELQSSWNARSVPVAAEVLELLERAMNALQAI